MATSTTISFENFDLEKALSGQSIAIVNGDVYTPILNFRKEIKGYVGNSEEGINYSFNANGISPKGEILKMLVANISTTSGTTGVRGGEQINIEVLQPREQFAIAALQGILNKIQTPILELDGGVITLITKTAFRIAQSMMNTAADYRAATQGGSTPPALDIDINNVTSTTDRILYNVSRTLEKINDTMVEDRDKTKKIDIASVTNGNIPIEVTNTPDVNVVNTPNVVATIPNTVSVSGGVSANITGGHVDTSGSKVSVSGTVSVDNFPTTSK